MSRSTITSKGQVTISAEIREALELKQGDKLLWKATEQGLEAKVERAVTVAEAYGILRQYAKPGTTREQEKAAVEATFARGERL